MTKKHFELIAEIIRNMPSHAETLRTQKQSCANSFADRFQREFARFDRKKFLDACGVYSQEEI